MPSSASASEVSALSPAAAGIPRALAGCPGRRYWRTRRPAGNCARSRDLWGYFRPNGPPTGGERRPWPALAPPDAPNLKPPPACGWGHGRRDGRDRGGLGGDVPGIGSFGRDVGPRPAVRRLYAPGVQPGVGTRPTASAGGGRLTGPARGPGGGAGGPRPAPVAHSQNLVAITARIGAGGGVPGHPASFPAPRLVARRARPWDAEGALFPADRGRIGDFSA